jgi:hypothetical protein
LVWILCFIVVVLMISKWVACSTSGMVIFPILSFSLVVSHCLLFPLKQQRWNTISKPMLMKI